MVAALLLASCATVPPERRVGLVSSLPIVWRETGSVSESLASGGQAHWALAVLREHGSLQLLDSLILRGGKAVLGRHDILLMAQPRPLAPQENLALDGWVRAGGRVLLFADPMLTAGSRFGLGDRRRPEDIAMLSPILGHWGLRLEFDEDQTLGEHEVDLAGIRIPVDLPGRLVRTQTGNRCRLLGNGLVAQCRIGRGRALVIADAALIDDASGDAAAQRSAVLRQLLALLTERDSPSAKSRDR